MHSANVYELPIIFEKIRQTINAFIYRCFISIIFFYFNCKYQV